MTGLERKPCSECGGKLRPRRITQEYEREGIRTKVAGIQAWVCSRSDTELRILVWCAGNRAREWVTVRELRRNFLA